MHRPHNVILGAGPAGIFCGTELNRRGIEHLIIEKENQPGGLAATHSLESGSYEIGPHILHTSDDYIMEIAREFLGTDLKKVTWKVDQFIAGKLLTFPNSLSDMIRQLGMTKVAGFVGSYLMSQFYANDNLEAFIYRKVGKKLAHFNVINYTEKMWGLPISELETEWIKPRMDRISIWKIIRSLYTQNKRSFFYPQQGAGQLYDKMAEKLSVKYNCQPTEIIASDDKIISVRIGTDKVEVDHLFSSIPLVTFINLLQPQPPVSVLEAIHGLIYRSQVYVILRVKDKSPIDSQWIYFPEKNIPFCRVHSPGNFSSSLISSGESIYVFEYFCDYGDKTWNMEVDNLVDVTMDHFKKAISRKHIEILEQKIMRNRYAYPLMVSGRQEKFTIVQDYLSQYKNLTSIGRHGLHTYDNQHDAGRTGIDAAIAYANKR